MMTILFISFLLIALIIFECGFPPPRRRALRPPKGPLLHRRAGPIRLFRNNRKLAFIVHGFPECPAPYRDIALALSRAGFDVVAPLLKGLGRTVADVEESGYTGYLEEADRQWRAFAPSYDERHLIAVSAGSLVALELCFAYADDPALSPSSASLVAPALFVNRVREGIIARPLAFLSRTAGLFFKSIGAGLPDPERLAKDGDARWMGHVGLYPRQSYEIIRAGKEIEKRLGGVSCPLLLLFSRGDRILPAAACARRVLRAAGSRDVSLRSFDFVGMEHAHHNLLLYDSSRGWALSIIMEFMNATFPIDCKPRT